MQIFEWIEFQDSKINSKFHALVHMYSECLSHRDHWESQEKTTRIIGSELVKMSRAKTE